MEKQQGPIGVFDSGYGGLTVLKELVQKLLSIASLDNSKVERHTLVDAPEEWLKNHPYFKYSADKIIFYRISNPDDRKIWKILKLKPEYEERMRLYVK